ncbi:hypothetical protein [Hoylesella enoeca]|uniref:hypothetical protein n=1 Tax=Hoylesella enoeca TaxID=76123 RepID=UPI002889685C|nr:hypothetical protein [Hoylesella enoeca]
MERKQLLKIGFILTVAIFTVACANDDTIQSEKQDKENVPTSTILFSGKIQSNTDTRTSITHKLGGIGKVTWDSTDKIWVQNDGGNWDQSNSITFPVPTNKSNAMFSLSGIWGGFSKSTHSVIYNNSYQPTQVTIAYNQSQSAPNNFDHAGSSGDCGIAEAKRIGTNIYKFTLDHKASYLCLLPRSSDPYVHRSKLIKIEIVSDDNIAGIYDIGADGTLTLNSNAYKTITLDTGSGFDLTNTATDIDKNGAYVVIAPGTHKLAIRYWLKNTTDFGNSSQTSGTITKYVTINCEAGKIHEITSNLTLHDYSHIQYYLWDAQQSFALNDNDGAINLSDPRFYNKSYGLGIAGEATHSAANCPNVNELCWYVKYGDTRRNEDELWLYKGRLYTGGIWIRTKAAIASKQSTTPTAMAAAAPDGVDYRASGTMCHYREATSIEQPFDIGDRFFIPGLCYPTSFFFGGGLTCTYHYSPIIIGGSNIAYWSSTALADYYLYAYRLFTGSGTHIEVEGVDRSHKNPSMSFE